jgi:predicted ATPase
LINKLIIRYIIYLNKINYLKVMILSNIHDALNENIRFDLHIHTFASAAKDQDLVSNSDAKHLDTLFENLEKNEINVFSFTDHNCFSKAMYDAAKEKIVCRPKQIVKEIIPGVEFDVKFDDDRKSPHVIAYFDNSSTNFSAEKLENALLLLKLKDPSYDFLKNGFKSLGDFSAFLQELKFNVLLVGYQRKRIDGSAAKEKGSANISDGSDDPYSIIETGFFSALECQKPNIESLIKTDLKEINYPLAIIFGSDCHVWEAYPFHDLMRKNECEAKKIPFQFYFESKAQPSFTGLLMSLSSPMTRINKSVIKNMYISYFEINGQKVPLSPGINAIIGENGTGKSSLFCALASQPETYQKSIISRNQIAPEKVSFAPECYTQNQIATEFKNDSLFSNLKNLLKPVSHIQYEQAVEDYSNYLKDIIQSNISKKKALEDLNSSFDVNLEYENQQQWFVSFEDDLGIGELENIYEKRQSSLSRSINLLKNEIENNKDFYINIHELDNLHSVIDRLEKVYTHVFSLYINRKAEIEVKNIISEELTIYSNKKETLSSQESISIDKYKSKKTNFIGTIVNAYKANNYLVNKVDFPSNVSFGKFASTPDHGFIFSRTSAYYHTDLKSYFYNRVFDKGYQGLSNVEQINTSEEFCNAVRGTSSGETASMVSTQYEKNVKNFLNDAEKMEDSIIELPSAIVGGTLGEQSLNFFKYKYVSDESNSGYVPLMIDQPEDNISNLRIYSKLCTYLDPIRYKRQIIIVTHTPLLVVNLDVDNVIFLKGDKKNGNLTIDVTNGCLESGNGKMLQIIEENMEGGKEAIEQRIKMYAKNN